MYKQIDAPWMPQEDGTGLVGRHCSELFLCMHHAVALQLHPFGRYMSKIANIPHLASTATLPPCCSTAQSSSQGAIARSVTRREANAGAATAAPRRYNDAPHEHMSDPFVDVGHNRAATMKQARALSRSPARRSGGCAEALLQVSPQVAALCDERLEPLDDHQHLSLGRRPALVLDAIIP